MDEKTEQIVCKGRKHEDQEKTGRTIKVKQVAEYKKDGVTQPVVEQQPLCIIANDCRRKKSEKKKNA